jgi:hypothetical protein
MLRRKTDSILSPRRELDEDIGVLPKFDDELSPREVMARLTSAIEKKIDDSFARRKPVSN